MVKSIDEMVRLDHGNDFTLIYYKEYEFKLKELFSSAEMELLEYGERKSGDSFKRTKRLELENVLSYRNKDTSNDKVKQLYIDYFLNPNLNSSSPLYDAVIAAASSYQLAELDEKGVKTV